jgi:hypothetical protein
MIRLLDTLTRFFEACAWLTGWAAFFVGSSRPAISSHACPAGAVCLRCARTRRAA